MNFLTLQQSLDNTVLGLSEPAFKSFKSKLELAINSDPSAYTVNTLADDDDQPDESGLLVLSVNGELVRNCGLSEDLCSFLGVTDLIYLEEDLREARDNPAVRKILLLINSPGGTAHVHSTVVLIQEISQEKDIIGYSDALACSAAYAIASACSEYYISETAMIGFIGTIFTRADYTKANDQDGVSYTFITSSPKKLYLNPNTSITPEEQSWIEATVLLYYNIFKSDVLANREIAEEYLDSSILIGEQAIKPNLADGVFNSKEDLIKKLTDFKSV